ncbi:uncharacterized protein MONBRDRAFT_9413 [Monosiga brevicollis MX1]|uniref:Uncharacterized protein n=1 Tax=Monosiga brevicollis TaxID=81824 RepID=A9V326_MONBE|nr:uncharacterized protein MONBRDRAFT_9413 [Monosiga brevicollis MX1]EDQ88113.1 predicted protein [Monosiga brevicollis MX1]|eukprot:XP_001747189.1 hypothetical protein [Monosiga brevicollis MX1]
MTEPTSPAARLTVKRCKSAASAVHDGTFAPKIAKSITAPPPTPSHGGFKSAAALWAGHRTADATSAAAMVTPQPQRQPPSRMASTGQPCSNGKGQAPQRHASVASPSPLPSIPQSIELTAATPALALGLDAADAVDASREWTASFADEVCGPAAARGLKPRAWCDALFWADGARLRSNLPLSSLLPHQYSLIYVWKRACERHRAPIQPECFPPGLPLPYFGDLFLEHARTPHLHALLERAAAHFGQHYPALLPGAVAALQLFAGQPLATVATSLCANVPVLQSAHGACLLLAVLHLAMPAPDQVAALFRRVLLLGPAGHDLLLELVACSHLATFHRPDLSLQRIVNLLEAQLECVLSEELRVASSEQGPPAGVKPGREATPRILAFLQRATGEQHTILRTSVMAGEKRSTNPARRRGEVMRVVAAAGSGKTATLEAYTALRPEQRFLFIAFNRSTVEAAAERFPPNVTCKTCHKLCMERKTEKLKDLTLKQLRLVGFWFSVLFSILKRRFVHPAFVDFMVIPDEEFTARHMRPVYQRRWNRLATGDERAKTKGFKPSDDQWQAWLIRAVNVAWQQSLALKELTFDGFIKAALKNSRSTKLRLHKFDCILVDEHLSHEPLVSFADDQSCPEAIARLVRRLLRVRIHGSMQRRGEICGPHWPSPADDRGQTRAFLTGTNVQALLISLMLIDSGFSGRIGLLGTSLTEATALARAFWHFLQRQSCANDACQCGHWIKTFKDRNALINYAEWSGDQRILAMNNGLENLLKRREDPRQLFAELEAMPTIACTAAAPPGIDVFVGTCFQAKGDEFDIVHQWHDVHAPSDVAESLLSGSRGSLCKAYVLLTRTRQRLHLNQDWHALWRQVGGCTDDEHRQEQPLILPQVHFFAEEITCTHCAACFRGLGMGSGWSLERPQCWSCSQAVLTRSFAA